MEPAPQSKPQPNPQPPKKEEAEKMSSAAMQQAESSQMDVQDLFAGVQLSDLEGILASGSQSPLGEPWKAAIPMGSWGLQVGAEGRDPAL